MDRQYWAPRDEDYPGENEDRRQQEAKDFWQTAMILIGVFAAVAAVMMLLQWL